MFRPLHLSPEEIDAVYVQGLKRLEAMHLTALINARVAHAFPPGHWDTDEGEDLIAAVRREWKDVRGEDAPGG